MAFLTNKTVNCLNVHMALVSLLEQSFNLFGPIYLYTRGFSVAEVLAFIAASIGLRLPMRFLSFPVIRLLGLKGGVMLGAAGYALTFPVLAQVRGVDGWLALYLALYSVFNSMHWFCYHTFYSLAGEHEKRGRQVAVAYALTATVSALAPLLSAVLIAQTGFANYFFLAFPLLALMLLNLCRCGDIPLPAIRWAEGKRVLNNLGVRIHTLESSITYPMTLCWIFVVYLYVGTITPLGGIVTFGIVVQVFYQLLLGSWVDRGRGMAIVHAAGGMRALGVLCKAFLPLSLPAILALQTLSATGEVHHLATEPTALYNSAKRSEFPLWFWFFTEMAWDAGTILGAGGAAWLLALGIELRHAILLALPSISLLWWVLHRYFSRHAYVRPDATA